MTKQEEIKEETKKLLSCYAGTLSLYYGGDISEEALEKHWNNLADDFVKTLHYLGIVRKVDIDYGEMDKIVFSVRGSKEEKKIYSVFVNHIECVATEPLIQEGE